MRDATVKVLLLFEIDKYWQRDMTSMNVFDRARYILDATKFKLQINLKKKKKPKQHNKVNNVNIGRRKI